jgi:hypothetical protein
MKAVRKFLPILLLLVFACSSMYGTYYTVDKQFTDAVTQYNIKFEAASPTLQARWKKEIDPVIIRANTALDLWKVAIDTEGNISEHQDEFLQLKTTLFDLLVSEGIIEIKEE